MFDTVAERVYLSRAEAVEALFARLRYLDDDEGQALAAAMKPKSPEGRTAIAAAWGVAAHAGRLDEAERAEHYVRAFVASARRFPWSQGNAVWPTKDFWRTIADGAVAHALALVTGDLLDAEHFELLYEPALATAAD